MAPLHPDEGPVPALLDELRALVIREGITEGVNLHVSEEGGRARLHLMAVDLGRVGLLLATLSDSAELGDQGSLSWRITPGGNTGADDRWQYELIAGRYPAGREIVFSAVIQLPMSDLPQVISRLSARS
jgi:hypothetical protein